MKQRDWVKHRNCLFSGVNSSLPSVSIQGDVQEARQSLLDGLDRSLELDRLVVRLSFSQCLYLISIHRLETLRSIPPTTAGHVTLTFNPFPSTDWRLVQRTFLWYSTIWRTRGCRESYGVNLSLSSLVSLPSLHLHPLPLPLLYFSTILSDLFHSRH